MKRRSFIWTVVAGVGGTFLLAATGCKEPATVPPIDITALFPKNARALGKALDQAGSFEETALAFDALFPQSASWKNLDGAAVRDRLQEAIHADFVAERMIAIEGWYVPETEAKLCVLASRA